MSEPEIRRQCAEEVRRWAENYPASVFPADSDSRDAIAGTALRTVLPRLADQLEMSDSDAPTGR